MKAVKLYFCVEMNSCNKVFENVIIDVLFIHLLFTLSCELPQVSVCSDDVRPSLMAPFHV